jgi:hypothetical protein
MTKSSTPNRRKGTPKGSSGTSKATNKSSISHGKKLAQKHSSSSLSKGKKDPPPADPIPPVDATPPAALFLLESISKEDGFSVFHAPLSVPLTKLFCQFPKSEKANIQGCTSKDRSFGNEDDQIIEQLLKRGTKLLDIRDPTPLDWHALFEQSFDPKFEVDAGSDMRDFSLNLAASDPLEIFPPEEIDRLGNLYEGRLSAAWIAATACHGSVHLFFDTELLSNKIKVDTYDSVIEDDDQYCVPTSGEPTSAYVHLIPAEQKDYHVYTYPERFNDTPDGRCLHDSIIAFSKYFKTTVKKMTIDKWRHYFVDASTKGTLIAAIGYGRQLRSFGSNLALSSPDTFSS